MSKAVARMVLVLGVLLLSVGGALGAVALGSTDLPTAILAFGGGLLIPAERLVEKLAKKEEGE